MAFFSLPTSSNGIQIPDSWVGGPLSSLYTKGGLEYTQYPRDLGADNKQHSVLFTVEEVKETGLQGIKDMTNGAIDTTTDAFGNTTVGSLLEKGKDLLTSALSGVASAADQIKNQSVNQTLKDTASTTLDGIAAGSKFAGNMQSKIQRTSGTPVAYIELYMPETLNFSSNMSYDDSTTIASAAGALPLIGDVVSKVTSGLQSDIAKLALNKAGYVFNPQKQMLFQGLEFRQFNMTFTFTPYSQDEAEAVRSIIQTFRKWSAPKMSDSFGGMFWVPPALFNIEFRYKGSLNPNLPRLQRCVVESVDVNYAPNGWSAHGDGAPVQTQMTVQFQEIVLIDRALVAQGY